MKILLHSVVFWPSVGGVETTSYSLAKLWSEAGHEVTVVTETPSAEEREVSYKVVRNPSFGERLKLVREHDVVHANGATLKCMVPAWLLGKPFSWTHVAYALVCIDAAGWAKGAPAPMTPCESIKHHARLFGMAKAITGGIKLHVRRFIGRQVWANVFISRHQLDRQPFPHAVVIPNPVEPVGFKVDDAEEAVENLRNCDASFTYLGRLISEKGVDDLLRAFALLANGAGEDPGAPRLLGVPSLKIIGDGPEGDRLKALAQSLNIQDSVRWTGSLTGEQLASEIRTAGICVIPSAWEEPMGNVILELMAAGKPIIVSQTGALSEIGGDACLTFPNRSFEELAIVMRSLFENKELQEKLARASVARAAEYNPQQYVDAYLNLFENLTRGIKP